MKVKDIIDQFIAGDWGEETCSNETPCAVTCVRGADIIPISEYNFSAIPIRYITQQSYLKNRLQVGDIIIEKSGGSPTQSTGRVSFVSQELLDSVGSVVCSNFCTAFRVKKGWNPLYVYYYFQFIYNLGLFFNFEGKTSGLKNLQLDAAFAAIPIDDVSESTQNKIVAVLQGLEKKIALNRQINQNLEAMAKQLYDYWFVQFDFPNEEGKPYKSSGGKMIWNEKLKREIPNGWNNCTLQEFLTIKNGRDHKHLATGSHPVYGSGGEMRRVNEYLFSGESVLMPRKGTLNNIMYVNESFWTVDTMFYSEMKIVHSAKYVFFAIKDIDFTKWNSGTGLPSMTASTLYNISMIKPSDDLLKRFNDVLIPVFYKIKQTKDECEKLIRQRDELLPLLMNGQVSVNSDLSVCINLIIRTTTRICSYSNDLFWSYLRIVFL